MHDQTARQSAPFSGFWWSVFSLVGNKSQKLILTVIRWGSSDPNCRSIPTYLATATEGGETTKA